VAYTEVQFFVPNLIDIRTIISEMKDGKKQMTSVAYTSLPKEYDNKIKAMNI